MKHIRQINTVDTNTYTVVKTDDWNQPLEQHPSVVNQPDVFEVADCMIPEYHQYLEYYLA